MDWRWASFGHFLFQARSTWPVPFGDKIRHKALSSKNSFLIRLRDLISPYLHYSTLWFIKKSLYFGHSLLPKLGDVRIDHIRSKRHKNIFLGNPKLQSRPGRAQSRKRHLKCTLIQSALKWPEKFNPGSVIKTTRQMFDNELELSATEVPFWQTWRISNFWGGKEKRGISLITGRGMEFYPRNREIGEKFLTWGGSTKKKE